METPAVPSGTTGADQSEKKVPDVSIGDLSGSCHQPLGREGGVSAVTNAESLTG